MVVTDTELLNKLLGGATKPEDEAEPTGDGKTFFDAFTEMGVSLGFHKKYCEILALSGIAGAVKNKRYIETEWGRINSNLFALLAGNSSTDYKTPSINFLKRVISHSGIDYREFYLPNDGTFEGLLHHMDEKKKDTGIMVIQEFSRWLGNAKKDYNKTFKNALCDLFDCETIDKSLSRGDVYIENPCVSMVAGIQPESYKKYFSVDDYELGLIPRLLISYPEEPLPFIELGNGAKNSNELYAVSQKFKRIYEKIVSSSELTLKPDATCLKYINRIRKYWTEKAGKNQYAEKFYMKYQLYLYKIAILLYVDSSVNRINISSVSSDRILYKAFKKSYKLTKQFLDDAIKIYGTIGSTEFTELTNNALLHIENKSEIIPKNLVSSAELTAISRTHLSKYMYDKYAVGGKLLDAIVSQLEDMDKIYEISAPTTPKPTKYYGPCTEDNIKSYSKFMAARKTESENKKR